jgi:SNF5 / SMARCB1 / INI1
MNFINWKYSTGNDNSATTATTISSDCLLIPIKIVLEIESTRIKDSFLYNFYCKDYWKFAQQLVNDWDYEKREEFVEIIAETIRNTCELYKYACRDDSVGAAYPATTYGTTLPYPTTTYGTTIPYPTTYPTTYPATTDDTDVVQLDNIVDKDIVLAVEETTSNVKETAAVKDTATVKDKDTIAADKDTIATARDTPATDKDTPAADKNTIATVKYTATIAKDVDSDLPFFPNGVTSAKLKGKGEKISYEDIRIVVRVCKGQEIAKLMSSSIDCI